MNAWTRGDDSTVYRFEKRCDGALILVVEVEVYDVGRAEVRAIEKPGRLTVASFRADNLFEALDVAREEWGLDAGVLPERPPVRVKRLALSLLADYVGRDAVFGHDVPAETRDALAAAYGALDEPGLPITFHDCPQDGAALDPLHDNSEPPNQLEHLKCPECGEVYVLNRDLGQVEIKR